MNGWSIHVNGNLHEKYPAVVYVDCRTEASVDDGYYVNGDVLDDGCFKAVAADRETCLRLGKLLNETMAAFCAAPENKTIIVFTEAP
jgi:hypothetical protein